MQDKNRRCGASWWAALLLAAGGCSGQSAMWTGGRMGWNLMQEANYLRLTLDGPETGLAVVGAPESAGTMRLIAVDLSRQTVLQEILLPELATRSESVEDGLEQLVAALMAAHHASGTCRREDHASTLRGP